MTLEVLQVPQIWPDRTWPAVHNWWLALEAFFDGCGMRKSYEKKEAWRVGQARRLGNARIRMKYLDREGLMAVGGYASRMERCL